jgi:hypothetical protein
MWGIEEIICIFSNILQNISAKKSFLWKSENDQKKKDYSPWVFVIIIGSLDCDHTLEMLLIVEISLLYYP